MSWKYYKKGKLKAECNDIPEDMDDAKRELRENGVYVSDCIEDDESFYGHYDGKIINDFWSPDYPPEEVEYKNTMMFKPVTDEEVKRFEEYYKILKEEGKALKVSGNFNDKLWAKINARKGVNMKPTRLERFFNWCQKWTDEEVSYLIFWIITIYVMIGVIRYEPKMIEIILWPFI